MIKIKSISIFFFFAIFFFNQPQVANGQPALCCPNGYSNGDAVCPAIPPVDQTKKCCKRYGLAYYDVIDKIICGNPQPYKATLVCPQGYGTSDADCPFGVDRTIKCCKRFGLFNYEIVDKIPEGTFQPISTMCCPRGFGTGDSDCPIGVDRTNTCCRRFGIGNYETISKVTCGSTVIGNYCCPQGYGTGDTDCPIGVDRTKKCCRRNSFGSYNMADKISCTLTAGNVYIKPKSCTTMGTDGIETAIGCIPTKNAGVFIGWLLGTAITLSGGIAFLLMIFGAFQIIISGGDPEKLNSGKEILTSAIAGLLMIIFSVVLLKIIGYDILRIPGIGIGGPTLPVIIK